MAIPSPSSLHFRYGGHACAESIYPDMGDFYRDLGQTFRLATGRAFADAGCRYLQFDEVNFAYSATQVAGQVAGGEDPEKLPTIYCRHDQSPRCPIFRRI